jgi:hypothetical protein
VINRIIMSTTKSVPIDAFVRRVSREVERIIGAGGEVNGYCFIQHANGHEKMLSIRFPSSAFEAGVLARTLRSLLRRIGIVRYAITVEIWHAPDATVQQQPKDHPNRTEAAIIMAEDDTGAQMTCHRYIHRPPGRAPHLGSLEMTGAQLPLPRFGWPEGLLLDDHSTASGDQLIASLMSKSEGRASEMITDEVFWRIGLGEPRVRFSKELAEDEGAVFAASMPGAPLGIGGRRDPRNGELCVGSIIHGVDIASLLSAPKMGFVEHVTGPEAERLIGTVMEKLSRIPPLPHGELVHIDDIAPGRTIN